MNEALRIELRNRDSEANLDLSEGDVIPRQPRLGIEMTEQDKIDSIESQIAEEGLREAEKLVSRVENEADKRMQDEQEACKRLGVNYDHYLEAYELVQNERLGKAAMSAKTHKDYKQEIVDDLRQAKLNAISDPQERARQEAINKARDEGNPKVG